RRSRAPAHAARSRRTAARRAPGQLRGVARAQPATTGHAGGGAAGTQPEPGDDAVAGRAQSDLGRLGDRPRPAGDGTDAADQGGGGAGRADRLAWRSSPRRRAGPAGTVPGREGVVSGGALSGGGGTEAAGLPVFRPVWRRPPLRSAFRVVRRAGRVAARAAPGGTA